MKLVLEIVGFVMLVAWIIDFFIFRHERKLARRQGVGESRRWWKESDDDLGDH